MPWYIVLLLGERAVNWLLVLGYALKGDTPIKEITGGLVALGITTRVLMLWALSTGYDSLNAGLVILTLYWAICTVEEVVLVGTRVDSITWSSFLRLSASTALVVGLALNGTY